MRFVDQDYEKGYFNYLTVFKKAEGSAETIDPNKIHSHFMKGLSMSRLFYFCVAIFLAMSIGHAQDINGKWKGEMQSPNGPMELTFNFKVNGDSLNGTVASPMGELPISNGKINGKTFSFDVNANEFTINHQCTVMSDSISMKVPGMPGGEDMAIILRRVPELNKESKQSLESYQDWITQSNVGNRSSVKDLKTTVAPIQRKVIYWTLLRTRIRGVKIVR